VRARIALRLVVPSKAKHDICRMRQISNGQQQLTHLGHDDPVAGMRLHHRFVEATATPHVHPRPPKAQGRSRKFRRARRRARCSAVTSLVRLALRAPTPNADAQTTGVRAMEVALSRA
jgi:hypothetical protein